MRCGQGGRRSLSLSLSLSLSVVILEYEENMYQMLVIFIKHDFLK